ncbi:MAG: alpha/beta hydrolase, partial [Gemmatimonadota bacterium]|nr:alpha/beta hydrolase [Gemmatimonadota bacterium]
AAARTKSVPARVPSDAVILGSPARHAIPVTLLNGSMDEAEFREAIGQWGAFAEEFSSIGNAEVVRLGTGHWPQFSDPDGLAEALVASLR